VVYEEIKFKKTVSNVFHIVIEITVTGITIMIPIV